MNTRRKVEFAAEIHATIKKSGLPPVVLVSGSSRAREFRHVAQGIAIGSTIVNRRASKLTAKTKTKKKARKTK